MKNEKVIPQAALGVTEDGEQFLVTLNYGQDSGGPSKKILAKIKDMLEKSDVTKGKVQIERSNIDNIIIFGGDPKAVLMARNLCTMMPIFPVTMSPGTEYFIAPKLTIL